jgi:hypothetical protein
MVQALPGERIFERINGNNENDKNSKRFED